MATSKAKKPSEKEAYPLTFLSDGKWFFKESAEAEVIEVPKAPKSQEEKAKGKTPKGIVRSAHVEFFDLVDELRSKGIESEIYKLQNDSLFFRVVKGNLADAYGDFKTFAQEKEIQSLKMGTGQKYQNVSLMTVPEEASDIKKAVQMHLLPLLRVEQ